MNLLLETDKKPLVNELNLAILNQDDGFFDVVKATFELLILLDLLFRILLAIIIQFVVKENEVYHDKNWSGLNNEYNHKLCYALFYHD